MHRRTYEKREWFYRRKGVDDHQDNSGVYDVGEPKTIRLSWLRIVSIFITYYILVYFMKFLFKLVLVKKAFLVSWENHLGH
jgi:hypothetical protein